MIRKLKSLGLNLSLIALSCIVGLLLVEVIVRLALPQALILRRPDVWYGVAGLGWNRAPNLDTMVNFGGAGHVRLITDEAGNRIGNNGKIDSPQFRILAIGDSFVEALQVEYEQTMTFLLQKKLTELTGLRTEVQCAGVGGWGPNQYFLHSKKRLANSHYDVQIIFFYLGNDIEKKEIAVYPPRHPAPYHNFRVPQNLSHKEIVEALFYPINDWLETKSHSFILMRTRMQPLLAKFGLTAEKIPFNVYRAVGEKDYWEITVNICRKIEINAARYKVPTLFVLIPPQYSFIELPLNELGYEPEMMDLTQSYRIMTRLFEAKGLRFVDLMPVFNKFQKQGIQCYGEIDSHFTDDGHRIAANTILPNILDMMRENIKLRKIEKNATVTGHKLSNKN